MRFRYHAWMTRQFNKQQFTGTEHVVYAGCALLLLAACVGVAVFWFMHPTIMRGVLLFAVLGIAFWIMAYTPSYDKNGKEIKNSS